MSSSSRERKWWSSIRWLVPTARATSRSDRPPTPPLAKASISASSSWRRRASSGGRGIAASRRLAARLEPLRLEVEVAKRHAPHEPADERAERAALVETLPHERSSVVGGHHVVRGERRRAGRVLAPRPRPAGVDRCDLPHEPGHAGLLDGEPASDCELAAVETAKRRHRRRPLRPLLDV